MSPRSFAIIAGLLAFANAFTQPKSQTWGPLLTPDLTHPVTQGETFTVTWDPAGHSTDGVTVSLVLCNGPSSNCVTQNSAIAEGIPAGQKSFAWSVPCSLPTGTQGTSSGYGMLIIVDGTGEFQFSTQFSVQAGSKCGGGSGSSSTTSGAGSSTTSAPPSSTTAAGTSTTHGGNGGYGDSTKSTTVTVTSTTSVVTDSITIHNSYTDVGPSSSAIASSEPVPSSVSMGTMTTVTSGYATASPSSATVSQSSVFTGAAAPRATHGVLGLVAGGALAMLAL